MDPQSQHIPGPVLPAEVLQNIILLLHADPHSGQMMQVQVLRQGLIHGKGRIEELLKVLQAAAEHLRVVEQFHRVAHPVQLRDLLIADPFCGEDLIGLP